VAPECLNPGISYHVKWLFIEALPVLLIFVFALIHVLKLLYKLACTNKKKSQLNAHLPTLVATIIVVFRLLYLYLTKTSMDALSCLATTPPEFKDKAKTEPILYMAGQIDYPCWQGWHLILFPMGLCFLILYSVTLPLYTLWFLRRHREAIKTDQLLRVKGMGNDELSNPKFYRFRKAYSKLYQHYRPGKWYWEGVIACRKFLIALCSLMFRQVGSYQLAMCLLVLFIAFVLQTQHLPYITHQNRQSVVDDHLAKALAGDKLHATIESDMRAVEKRNTRKRQKQNLFDNIVSRKTKDASALVVLFIFDANTVESILLASAILVNLAGVMLDSKRFAGDSFYVNQNEYTGLAIGTVFVIALTIAYYATTILLELMTVFCPNRIGPLIGCLGVCFRSCGRKALQEAMIKAKGKRGGVGARSSAFTSDMHVNPFLVKQGANELSVDPSSGIIDMSQIASIDMPTSAMWRAVQGSYGRLTDMTTDLQAELRTLKRELEDGASKRGPVAGKTAVRSRTQFKPAAAHADDADGVPGAFAAAATPPPERPKPVPRASTSGRSSFVATAGTAGLGSYSNTTLRALKSNVVKSARRVSMGLRSLNTPAGSRLGGDMDVDEHGVELSSRTPRSARGSGDLSGPSADGETAGASIAVAANPFAADASAARSGLEGEGEGVALVPSGSSPHAAVTRGSLAAPRGLQ